MRLPSTVKHAVMLGIALCLAGCADDSYPQAAAVAVRDDSSLRTTTGAADVLQIQNAEARRAMGSAAVSPFMSQLRYSAAEQGNKSVVHRAEVRESTPPPVDTVVEYGWRVMLVDTFPVSRYSINTATWYDNADTPILQHVVALDQLWVELQLSSKHEQVYKPHPVGVCTKGAVHVITASVVWSTNPDKGRVLLWCDDRELFRYRGATLSTGVRTAPRLGLGLSYRGTGRGVAILSDQQKAYYADMRRRIAQRASEMPPAPPIRVAKVRIRDAALDAVEKPIFSQLTPTQVVSN